MISNWYAAAVANLKWPGLIWWAYNPNYFLSESFVWSHYKCYLILNVVRVEWNSNKLLILWNKHNCSALFPCIGLLTRNLLIPHLIGIHSEKTANHKTQRHLLMKWTENMMTLLILDYWPMVSPPQHFSHQSSKNTLTDLLVENHKMFAFR